MRGLLLVVSCLTLASCSARTDLAREPLVFLTRAECVQTDLMRERLDAALVKAGWLPTYQVLDLNSLDTQDSRNGYPTPTLLYRDRDLYGMPAPVPPFPEPT